VRLVASAVRNQAHHTSDDRKLHIVHPGYQSTHAQVFSSAHLATNEDMSYRIPIRSLILLAALPVAAVAQLSRNDNNGSGSRTRPVPDTDLVRVVGPIVEAGMSEFKLPAISLVIMRGHTVLLSEGYGMADLGAATPATSSTVYAVGSLSKQMTAAAIMTLVESGRVGLDDPVSRYLPELPVARDSALRIRTLLRQTSGLPTWDELPEMQNIDPGADSTNFTLARIVTMIGKQRPLFPPGSWWSYSNTNYTLLAAIIERVTGMTYDEYLAKTIFRPLGMRATKSCSQPAGPKEFPHAVGYDVVGDSFTVRHARAYLAPGMTGAGGLCSNVVDLASWMRALVDGRVVSRESYRTMTTATRVGAGFSPPYGFGVSLLPFVDQTAVWHTGVMAGFMSTLVYLPKRDVIIAATGNSRHALLDAVVKRVARRILGVPRPALHDLPIDAIEVAHSAGTYDDAMFRFRIVADSGHLYADVPELGARERLLYQGNHEFVSDGPWEFHFRFDSAGARAQTVTWDWAEIRAFGKRVE